MVGVKAKKAGRQAVFLVVAMGLLFLGWGVGDLRGFFGHPARVGYLIVLLVLSAIVMLSRLDLDPFRKGKKTTGRWLLGAWAVFGFVLGWFLPFGDHRGILTFADAGWLRYAGLGLVVGGGTLRLVAVRALGKQFSAFVTLQVNHQLVQTSIYGWIRHPMYLGYLLVLPGIVLIFRSWLVIPVFVSSAIFVVVRIGEEEKLLAEHFGSEFDAYRRRTWLLLPYLY
jgi:protein-S-isoprenylcysteine O-methyltransferase Ste14